jgi:hypothetical protein
MRGNEFLGLLQLALIRRLHTEFPIIYLNAFPVRSAFAFAFWRWEVFVGASIGQNGCQNAPF